MMEDVNYLRLSIQCALLQMVRPNLRSVIVDIDTKKKILYYNFFFDGELSDEDLDMAEVVITESSADFSLSMQHVDRIERIDYPQKIICKGTPVYARDESIIQKDSNVYEAK